MAPRTRLIASAAVAGLLAAAVSIFGGVWLRNALDDEPEFDGEFVLDEPGVFQQPSDAVNDDSSGDLLPDVELTDASGAVVRLSEYRGRPLVVNVWFSRCAPCARELRDFADVHADLGDDVQFVGIDPFDTVATMESFAAERGVTYDLLRDDERAFTNAIGIIGYPVTLFVDADGEILRQTGVIDADGIRAAIEELF
jgi:peroxiredoxin